MEKRLHPSISSHLDTDLSVLEAVIERSKFQHRSQPFLRRMREVLRLGRRVAVLVNDQTTVVGSSDQDRSNAVQGEIVVKFIQCLLKATVSIQQIIELEHFLPTQISVIAIYGRLFALSSSIADNLGMEMEEMLGVPLKKVKKRKSENEDEVVEVLDEYIYTPAPGRSVATIDMGQKISRPVREPSPIPEPIVSVLPRPASDSESDSATPPPSSPDLPPSPVRIPTPPPEKPRKKKRTIPDTGVKKKVKGKKNDMDDIFGF